MEKGKQTDGDAKRDDLELFGQQSAGQYLTTDQGLRINDDQNSLKAGERGPSLLEDFILREKITHFDHERIPERAVHARGAGAHGYFQVYASQAELTQAGFLQNPAEKTPVFARFSTVAGSRGSSDMARDVRGFAVKFYTNEGIYDLVGNNMPVFFIQDAIKFPDLIHAVKPEPHNEIPQAASAHDTFWDFISLMPESLHMIMWVMSDRAMPRSLRMMEGFGVHTFRFINAQGKSRFVKFHWKPLLGVHTVAWNEAMLISGQDPDFQRRDLWEAIEIGDFPEWELGVQIVEDEDEHKFDFDLLDPTKLIPEELVPVLRIGKMVLNRNPDNYFAETEQVAFHPGHLVPGIDFTDDPLLQGRLFSYTDTQLSRLGGPNFHEIPINRTVADMHNNQRDGHMRQAIDKGGVAYSPNTLGGGCPMQAGIKMGGFVSYGETTQAYKTRGKGQKFFDHFSQAAMFFHSQSDWEQAHIVSAFQFELGKLQTAAVRERMLGMLAHVDGTLAARVATGLGIAVPESVAPPLNHAVPADARTEAYEPRPISLHVGSSAALSMANKAVEGIRSRKVAILAADGVDEVALLAMFNALFAAGAHGRVVAPRGGVLTGVGGTEIQVDHSLLTTSSVLFDAIYVPGGAGSVATLKREGAALQFIDEAYRHCKTIAATCEGCELVDAAYARSAQEGVADSSAGIILGRHAATSTVAADFIAAVALHRHWRREMKAVVV
ncbi:catalase [Chitinimonas viridis]|uniref:Catalase n=1 Tax=Chitinimonas viridis TaxID=664880 RepID=A0ABT8B1C4_9NEIS|nr:catalase [Chitinimonas viridis]MDN3575501.1 catalase [Chitinimonas viridis]